MRTEFHFTDGYRVAIFGPNEQLERKEFIGKLTNWMQHDYVRNISVVKTKDPNSHTIIRYNWVAERRTA